MDLKQILLDQLSGSAADSLGSRNGLDASQTNSAMDSALTAILSGLQQNVSSSDGANKVDKALANDHNGSVLDDIVSSVGSAGTQADGTKILSHIFGSKKAKVAGSVAKDAGVSNAAAGDILSTLAPIVLGQLGKQKQSGGLDAGGLMNILLGHNTGQGNGGLADVVSGMFTKKNAGILALILGFLKMFMAKK